MEIFTIACAYWTTDDVWEYLGLCRQTGTGYSDFDQTFQIYADAGASTCAVVLKWPWGSIHVPRLVEVALAAFVLCDH